MTKEGVLRESSKNGPRSARNRRGYTGGSDRAELSWAWISW